MRRLTLTLLFAAGCAKAAQPPEVPPVWQPLIGEYASARDTVSILEDGGTLQLYRWHGSRSALRSATDSTLDIAGHAGRVVVRRGPDRRTLSVVVSGVEFNRLALGPEGGASFQIAPRRPVEELRREALAARPPAETGDFLPTDLVELVRVDTTIRLDIRYAGTNNFMSTPMYSSARAFLQRPAAEGVARANQWLRTLAHATRAADPAERRKHLHDASQAASDMESALTPAEHGPFKNWYSGDKIFGLKSLAKATAALDGAGDRQNRKEP